MTENEFEQLTAEWRSVCNDLRRKLGDSAFESWLEPMTPGALKDGTLCLFLPTRFMRDYIVRHFADEVTDSWLENSKLVKALSFEVGVGRSFASAVEAETPAAAPATPSVLLDGTSAPEASETADNFSDIS